MGNSHTAAAWVQAVPQQARMQAAVVAGPASTGSGLRPRLRMALLPLRARPPLAWAEAPAE